MYLSILFIEFKSLQNDLQIFLNGWKMSCKIQANIGEMLLHLLRALLWPKTVKSTSAGVYKSMYYFVILLICNNKS